MDANDFRTNVETVMEVTQEDVVNATNIEERAAAIKNWKIASDVYLDNQKMEYAHIEAEERIENDAVKITNDDRNFNVELEYKMEQAEIERLRRRKELAIDIGKFALNTSIVCLFALAGHRFETGGSFTSTIGRVFSSAFGRNIVDRVKI